MSLRLPDPEATESLGGRIATVLNRIPGTWLITLQGGLGAGKTTLVRGFLRALGYGGRVPSPTYTLIEPYDLEHRSVLHVDLYRLSDPEELEYLGFRELFSGDAVVLVEWPERAGGSLPAPDLSISMEVSGSGRVASIHAGTDRGKEVLGALGC